jgi:hypothetical protein
MIPKNVTLLTFLPDWWKTYEAFVLDSAQHAPYGPVSYCRLAATPPPLDP